ncbi:hypothetical protein CDQ92_07660 [Sphingopyxis bauzanensis]|uniref:Response regulatory domain-containing protein n=3 Tax=Sphingopyxis bauzanensis TaxID=651663 RepID=A0A246JVL0_9SPHN|nr:hypothetical protein CDQ92_07660 [Sphingopyxis bauzanensis]
MEADRVDRTIADRAMALAAPALSLERAAIASGPGFRPTHRRDEKMSKQVLIVEDDAFIALLLEEFVDILGHQTAAIVDRVGAALERIALGGIDVAVVDVHLANGEMADAIAMALADRAIPFLVATGGFVGEAGPAWRGRPVLAKPFNLEDLRSGLAPLLERTAREPEAPVNHS